MPRPKRPPAKAHERTHGEGTIVEVSPGVFRAWRAPDAENKRTSKRFASHAAAHRWLVGDPEPEILYVGPHLERWLELRAPTLRGRTPETYAQFLGYAEGGGAPISPIPLLELTGDDCQAWLNGLLKTHARSSVKTTKTIVSIALNDAVRKALIPKNPLRETRLPKPDERPVKAWTRAEVAKLLHAARGSHHAIWLAFAIGTGLRLGELRALELSDLDLEKMTVKVSKSLDNNSNAKGPTKSGRTRVVDVPDELRPQLVEHLARMRPGARYLFGKEGRTPYRPTSYRDWLKRLCLRAGVHDADLKTLSVHSTRHTFASLALADPECFLPDVAHTLGHASMNTTLGIYGHFIDHERRRTAKALGRVFASLSPDLHRDLHREAASTR